MLWVSKRSKHFVFLISQPPLILLITLFSLSVFLNGKILSWIQSYLTSRSFKVILNILNGTESPIYQLFYGVSQGYVLGPLLFTLYSTPLSSLISHSTVNSLRVELVARHGSCSALLTTLELLLTQLFPCLFTSLLSLNPVFFIFVISVNLETFFKHENQAYPPSISEFGTLHIGSKSVLLSH